MFRTEFAYFQEGYRRSFGKRLVPQGCVEDKL